MCDIFKLLEQLYHKPEAFSVNSSEMIWKDAYISGKMLEGQLDIHSDLASRNLKFINRSVCWMIGRFSIGPDCEVLDVGCGAGYYTRAFAATGARTNGIDISVSAIRYCRNDAIRNKLNINYLNESYIDFQTELKFDLITLVYLEFSTWNAALRKKMLDKLGNMLKPGGHIVFDVFSDYYFDTLREECHCSFVPEKGLWSPLPFYNVRSLFKYPRESVFLEKCTIIDEKQTRIIYNWYQCYSVERIREVVQESGFHVKALFSDIAGKEFSEESPEYTLILCKK